MLLIFFVIFKLLQKFGTDWWVAGAWAYVIFYAALMILGNPLVNFIAFENLFALLYLLFWACIVIGIIGLFAGSRTPPQGGRP